MIIYVYIYIYVYIGTPNPGTGSWKFGRFAPSLPNFVFRLKSEYTARNVRIC